MTSRSDLRAHPDFRKYEREECVVFRKTNEAFGGLSNMAAGFPIEVNGLAIRTSEALYQACRFPHRPDLQRLIIQQASPMAAKMVGKPHRSATRPDWDDVRVDVMRWCLRVKLEQNWDRFHDLLLATGEKPIVEESRRDDYWGAKPTGQMLAGRNVLGRLLMELRQQARDLRLDILSVDAPRVTGLLVDGRPVDSIHASGFPDKNPVSVESADAPTRGTQTTLFPDDG